MGYLQKTENRNAAQARDSFVTKKAEQKISALANVFKEVAGDHFVGERRNTLQRTLAFSGYRYFDNLKLVYNWENRFLSVNYNLQMINDVYVTRRFKEVGPCKFDLTFSRKRHADDKFVALEWNSDDHTKDEYLERLNNPLIIDRIHKLDIQGVTITREENGAYFRISMESLIGSGAWIFIPPVMQLITPNAEECTNFMELFALLGDAVVNNQDKEAIKDIENPDEFINRDTENIFNEFTEEDFAADEEDEPEDCEEE